MGRFFDAQGYVALKRIVRSSPKWISSAMLCLSLLRASLKIPSKLKVLSCPQHFFRCSRAGNFEVNGWMWAEFELFRDYMAVLVTCKFDGDTVQTEGVSVSTTFSPL